LLETVKTTLLFVSALFPIVNPLGGSPIFLALTRDYSTSSRTLLSRQIAINSFILLVVSFLIGTHILAFFGISLPIVQVGGGLVVISTGWSMLGQKDEDDPRQNIHHNPDPTDVLRNAFYPLTLPLTVGPGSISVAITLGANETRNLGLSLIAIFVALVGSALIALSIFICYAFADRLAMLLGATGMSVIMRLSSFLLVCIGVQILWNGAGALLRSLPQIAH
jgi:multiple antibiotic resistance protein